MRPHDFIFLSFLLCSSNDFASAFIVSPMNRKSGSIGLTPPTCLKCADIYRRRKMNNVHSLTGSIIPISQNKIYDLNLVSREVTAVQWGSYWGANSKERLQRVLESLLVAYGGAWFAWFVSFMAGGLAPFVGTLLVFNWLYSPWLNAKRRNDKFWSSPEQYGRSKYALYSGEIMSISKLNRRSGKSIGAFKQEYMQVIIRDENDRQLEIITQWQEMYRRLKAGMQCEGILVSPSNSFTKLELITDFYVPKCDIFFGDYPYLNKRAFAAFMKSIGSAENRDKGQRKKKRNDRGGNSFVASQPSERSI